MTTFTMTWIDEAGVIPPGAWITVREIADALKPTRVVISPPSPCRAPVEPLTAGQRMQAEGVQRAVAALNRRADAFMPCAARFQP